MFEDSVIIHKDSKHQKHVCDTCGMEYTSEHYLKEHKIKEHKIGSEINEWVCETCAFSAPTKKMLGQHMRKKHVFDKHHKCPHCEYHSVDLKHVHVHIDSKHPEHGEKTFFCNHCSRSFIFESSLKKHLQNQSLMARNREKKMSLGLMQRNRKL